MQTTRNWIFYFSIIKLTAPDFFIFNGDQIYADGTCNDLTDLVKNNIHIGKI